MARIRDLKLTEDLDVAIENGDLAYVEDADAVAQKLRIRLRRQMGEWYLDITSGVDYLGDVFPKGGAREAAIRQTIVTTPYVTQLVAFEASFDGATRILKVDFSVDTEFGPVTMHLETP